MQKRDVQAPYLSPGFGVGCELDGQRGMWGWNDFIIF